MYKKSFISKKAAARFFFDGKPEYSGKTKCTKYAQSVLLHAKIRVSDRSDDSIGKIFLPADKINDFPVSVHCKGVDREVAPFDIFFERAAEQYVIRSAGIRISTVYPIGSDFNRPSGVNYSYRSMGGAGRQCLKIYKNLPHLHRCRIRRQIKISRGAAEK